MNQLSVTPPASLPSPWMAKFNGLALGIVASSMAWICCGPSAVFRFQVNDTRSRQYESSPNIDAATPKSPRDSAPPKSESHCWICAVGVLIALVSCGVPGAGGSGEGTLCLATRHRH